MDRRTALGAIGSLGGVSLAGCLATDGGSADGESEGGAPALALTTQAFEDGEPIPTRYTCDGEDVSPELAVSGDPGDAASLALVVDDPDAPGRAYTHWLLWNVPVGTETIPEGVEPAETAAHLGGANQGTNDAGVVGYSGPCPPPSHDAHTYRYRLLVLTEPIDLEPGADRSSFDEAVGGRVSAETVLHGTYDR